MAVRIVGFNADGTVAIWHDEEGHGATAPANSIRFVGTAIAGLKVVPTEADRTLVTVTCPCGTVSTHPVGGMVGGREVQRYAARRILAVATKLNLPNVTNWDEARALIKRVVVGRFGPTAWQIEDLTGDT